MSEGSMHLRSRRKYCKMEIRTREGCKQQESLKMARHRLEASHTLQGSRRPHQQVLAEGSC